MLSLDSPRWAELEHAYGSAADIPALLRQLTGFPGSAGGAEPWFSLFSALAHQGEVYSASFAAVPHVIEALASDPTRAGFEYFSLPAWVEVCRRTQGVAIPQDLETAYLDSLARLPALAAAAAAREWDEVLLRSALAAIAAAKGRPEIAEVLLELTPEVADEFLEWLSER